MIANKPLLIGFVFVTVVAGSLRFYRIGDWSFSGDEIATFAEEQSLFSGQYYLETNSYESQYNRLPRLIPLGYLFQHFDYALFGRDELGSRILPAIIGTATVALTFLLMVPLSGLPNALATSLLVAFWQLHVLFSQSNRFYALATLFGFATLLVGAYGVKSSRPLIPIIVFILAIAALLSHTVAGGVYGLVCIGVIAAAVAQRRRIATTSAWLIIGGAVLLGIVIYYHVLPLSQGWNELAGFSESPKGAVIGTINRIGWPIMLLAILGAVMAALEGGAIDWYWLACTLAFFVVTYIIPFKFSFSARYVIPISLPVFVLAGFAIARIFGILRERRLSIAVAWILLLLMMGLPSLMSHYIDGSRSDLRSAIQFIADNRLDGDAFCSPDIEIALDYYAPTCKPRYSLRIEPVDTLEKIAASRKRIWIVKCDYRGISQDDLQKWLDEHCSVELRVEKNRYDYYRYGADVYLYDPNRQK
jgi:hypothetical protein